MNTRPLSRSAAGNQSLFSATSLACCRKPRLGHNDPPKAIETLQAFGWSVPNLGF